MALSVPGAKSKKKSKKKAKAKSKTGGSVFTRRGGKTSPTKRGGKNRRGKSPKSKGSKGRST